MSNSDDRQGEGLSRQEAAERLIDVAYALAAGGKLTLDDDQEVDLPIVGQVTLERRSASRGGRSELAIKLSWLESS